MSSAIIDHCDALTGEIDGVLAATVRAALAAAPLPAWPEQWGASADAVTARIAFHGIAPILGTSFAGSGPAAQGWPDAVQQFVRKQTALAGVWEAGHREVLSRLLEAFAAAGIAVIFTKGTALAYSAYPSPAMRRRGDSDLVVLSGRRAAARAVLTACGFVRDADPRPLQEDWQAISAHGIRHTVDVHWRLNASATISGLLEQGRCFAERLPLPALAPGAEGIGRTGNVILTCINRHSHGVMGYYIDHTKQMAEGRLIWAVDLLLLTRDFAAEDWNALADDAQRTGTASIVHSGLAFAAATLGAPIPPAVLVTLAQAQAGDRVARYFATVPGAGRLRSDLAASPRLQDKLRLLHRVAFPSDAFLAERFPTAQGWPRSLLHLRRVIEGLGKAVRRLA